MRLQTLLLPHVVDGQKVTEPFAFIVDQAPSSAAAAAYADEILTSQWRDFAAQCGARAVIVTPETVQVGSEQAEPITLPVSLELVDPEDESDTHVPDDADPAEYGTPPATGYRLVSLAEVIARGFHETYERLAPTYGYTTRRESAVLWNDVPASNKALMVATVQSLLDQGVISRSGG
ncbi:hypothetical protein [Planotetraspora phitsanulokensis]|uniref:Uncharacterized protein n=1 Tax=Planotetraspora phitsanulokensis TaxID=575192 RepID=A0A8J3XJ15_9ACTN|nr:hypothetical protein [Planotetraspora phitsanulokensis]GII42949.1 hypothetical protein Pph01_79520 [Planotetraspora phitsanulokensis]